MTRLGFVAALLTLVLAEAASAQSIRCLVPFEASPTTRDCVVHQASGATSTDIVVEVRDQSGNAVGAGQTVTARPSSGSLQYPRRTGPDGLVKATLTGSVTADVEVEFTSGSAVRKVIVKPALPTPVPLDITGGDKQYWFQGFELEHPVVVTLKGITSPQCEKTPVIFRPVSGGKLLADTVFGAMSQNRNECQASTRWTLDNRIGYQGLRAATPGDKQGVVIEARSRRLPRVFLGAHLGWQEGWMERKSKPDTAVITTPLDGGGQKVTKEISKNYKPDDHKREWSLDPVVGFDFPIWYTVEWLRLSLGVAIDNYDKEWFVGASIIQPFKGFLQESLGMDLHFVLNVVRRDEVVDPSLCEANECKTDEEIGFGFGFMVVTDGVGAVSSLVKALGGG